MANSFIGGSFEDDGWARANETGTNISAQKPTPATNNSNLLANPYLIPSESSFTRTGDINISRESSFESGKNLAGFTSGTLEFNSKTISPEFRIQMLKNELQEASEKPLDEEKLEEVLEDNSNSKKEDQVKQKTMEYGAKTVLTLGQVSKGIFGFFKEIFGALKSLYKENIGFRVYSKEQKEKMEAEKRTRQAQGAVKQSFFGKITENSKDLYIQTNRKLVELEDRLGISGLSIFERNKYLGRRRNMSHEERNIHLAHFTARGLQEEQEDQIAQQKRVQAEQEQRKSAMDLNKVAEGGSILSSTGGQGAG